MKQVIEVNDLSELREEEGKLYVCRRYDSGCDGNLWYKGDTTIDHYIELCEQRSKEKHPGIFFAYNDEQLVAGFKSLGYDIHDKESWKGKVFSYCETYAGMFGTHDGMEAMLKKMAEYEKKIVEECDPQEIYIYEYNNHECHYSGDQYVYDLMCDYFGKDIAQQIKRF